MIPHERPLLSAASHEPWPGEFDSPNPGDWDSPARLARLPTSQSTEPAQPGTARAMATSPCLAESSP
jgi:hypothetical protein